MCSSVAGAAPTPGSEQTGDELSRPTASSGLRREQEAFGVLAPREQWLNWGGMSRGRTVCTLRSCPPSAGTTSNVHGLRPPPEKGDQPAIGRPCRAAIQRGIFRQPQRLRGAQRGNIDILIPFSGLRAAIPGKRNCCPSGDSDGEASSPR